MRRSGNRITSQKVGKKSKLLTGVSQTDLTDRFDQRISELSSRRWANRNAAATNNGLPPPRQLPGAARVEPDPLPQRPAQSLGVSPGINEIESQRTVSLLQRFSGSMFSLNAAVSRQKVGLVLKVRFDGSRIVGEALIDQTRRFVVKGIVYPRGFEIQLNSADRKLRLTGVRRGDVLRGTFDTPGRKSGRGRWEASLAGG